MTLQSSLCYFTSNNELKEVNVLPVTQDMMAKEVRIRELTLLAEKLKVEHYTEYEMIREMIEVRKNVLNYQVMGVWVFKDDNLLTSFLSVRIP